MVLTDMRSLCVVGGTTCVRWWTRREMRSTWLMDSKTSTLSAMKPLWVHPAFCPDMTLRGCLSVKHQVSDVCLLPCWQNLGRDGSCEFQEWFKASLLYSGEFVLTENSSHFSGFCIETLEIIILCGHLQFFPFVLLSLPNWCFVGPVCTVVCCPQGWIHEKAKLIESTDELGNDLAGVMTLQRRLSTMERDLAAIQAKVRKWRFAAATERGGNIKCKEWRESYPVISS